MEELFNEFFGSSSFRKLCNTLLKEFGNWEDNKNVTVNDNEDETQTYYHKVADKYDNGKHVSHVEKEVKNGEVLKDVNENYNLENKDDKKPISAIKDSAECKCNGKCECKDKDYYENLVENLHKSVVKKDKQLQSFDNLLTSAENACVEKDKEIKRLKEELLSIKKEKDILLNKFEQLRDLFK